MICSVSGHNEIRDLTAMLFTEVCTNMRTEPELQPLTGEILSFSSANRVDSARLGIRVHARILGRCLRLSGTHIYIIIYKQGTTPCCDYLPRFQLSNYIHITVI